MGRPPVSLAPPSIEPRPPVPSIKQLTPSEAREWREKGLCYHCDERYRANHRCKTQKLFWVEGLLQEDEEDDGVLHPTFSETLDPIHVDTPPQISLHAIAAPNYACIRDLEAVHIDDVN